MDQQRNIKGKPLKAHLQTILEKMDDETTVEEVYQQIAQLTEAGTSAEQLATPRNEAVSDKKEVLSILRTYFPQQPIHKAWLFGSFAKGGQQPGSDVDILVQFIRPNKLDLFDYIGISQELEDLLGRKVDLVEDGYLLPEAVPQVEQEKELIYERET